MHRTQNTCREGSPSSPLASRILVTPIWLSVALASISLLTIGLAQTDTVTPLEEIVVSGESESDDIVQGSFLPNVQGTKINSGKRNSVIDLDELPEITGNNYRQALVKTPGLYLSEETTPLVSIGYRGLDPGRIQYMQVLRDGIPIHADQFGYPEAYYTPPLDTVDRIEFLRGGAALMYGPQPGGSLNFVTHRPRLDKPFSFSTKHTFGSDEYYSTFSRLDGTIGRVGYYGYFNHRQSEGFRTYNSAYNLNAGSIKLVLDGDTDSRWILSLDSYEEEHGEPGGLTFAEGPLAVNYNKNRDASSRRYDHFELRRQAASLAWEKDFSEATKMTITGWASSYNRWSSRQRGGGFGTLPTGPDADTTTIESQDFYTLGFEARLRHDYELWGGTHTIAGGFQVYHTDSPREERRGDEKNANGGDLRIKADRETLYLPFFVENRFHWGRFSITPGVRFENIWQNVTESKNVDKKTAGVPLGDEKDGEFVPLFGLGLAYEVADKTEIYGNVSQSYRPKIFTQSVPTGGTFLIPNDLEESKAWQYEVGFRGNPQPWITWDVSAFLLDFDDTIGNIALPGGRSTVANVGRSINRGVDVALEVDVIGLMDALNGTELPPPSGKSKDKVVAPVERSLVDRYGSLNLFGNVTFLDSEFVSGPLDGRTPRYAPNYLVRAGAIYSWRDRFKVAFLGTFVGDSYADDSNTTEREVPAYMTWDLTVEAKVYKDIVSVHAGINNVFNEDYYSRVTDLGIDPAYGRNYYAGFSLQF